MTQALDKGPPPNTITLGIRRDMVDVQTTTPKEVGEKWGERGRDGAGIA